MRGIAAAAHCLCVGTKDVTYKRAFAVDPRGLLHMLGRLDCSADATVAEVNPELVVPPKLTDLMYVVDHGEHHSLEILEALAYWDDRESDRIAERVAAAMLIPAYKPRPLKVTVALLDRKACPAVPAPSLKIDREAGVILAFPAFVRMWELDPVAVMALGRPALFPWVTLMDRATPEVLEQAARAVAHDEELVAHFALLGSIKYEREWIDDLLGRFSKMMTVELARQTPLGKWIREGGVEEGLRQGRVEGLVEGRVEGLVEATIHSIEKFLRHRYPLLAGTSSPAGLDLDAAERLLDRLYEPRDEAKSSKMMTVELARQPPRGKWIREGGVEEACARAAFSSYAIATRSWPKPTRPLALDRPPVFYYP